MRAIFQFTMIGDVDDEEHAGEVAAGMEKSAQLNMLAAAEQHGLTTAELATAVQLLGTSVFILNDEEES